MNVPPIQTNMLMFYVCFYTLVIKYLRFCISHFLRLVLLSRIFFLNKKNIQSLCKNRKISATKPQISKIESPQYYLTVGSQDW